MGWFSDRAADAPDPSRIAQLEERVRRLEATVALLAAERGVGPAEPAPAGAAPVSDPWVEARALAHRGNKIQAIKLVREQTGMGLKEAKDLVDSW